ncbi:MAG TPA: LppX_LprAFG lipoprotein [Pseudonocardiaceae bacterium]|jgi:lipoprotein LprG|nr:LppX_LprAFG lipoprotein [Pseudonocardiaceae bacterium]
MSRRLLPLLALLAVLCSTLLTSCGQREESLPPAAGLLAESAAAMRTVTSTRVDLDVHGELPGVPLKSAAGQLTREGAAQGTASLDMGEQPFEVDFIILGQELYLRGPTGGFRKLATSSAFLVYNPTVILDPNRGIAAVLASGTEASTEAREPVGGVDSYRVQAKFPRQSLDKLVPGYTPDSVSRVWIAAAGFRLVQAEFPTTGGTVSFRFSNYNAPADIRPPA